MDGWNVGVAITVEMVVRTYHVCKWADLVDKADEPIVVDHATG